MSDQPVLAGPDRLKPVRRRILYARVDVARLPEARRAIKDGRRRVERAGRLS